MRDNNFHHQAFYFVGDGRNGTKTAADNDSLARNILCNAAACLINSGEWELDNEAINADIEYWGASVTSGLAYVLEHQMTYLCYSYTADYSQTNPHVFYMFLKRANSTAPEKIMLMYQATLGNAGLDTLTGGNGNQSPVWMGTSRRCCCDLSMIYIPANGGTWAEMRATNSAKNFKILTMSLYQTWSVSDPIAAKNTNNVTYIYHVITNDEMVSIFLTKSSSSYIHGYTAGKIIEPNSLSSNDISAYKEYASVSFESGENASNALDNVSSTCFVNNNRSSFALDNSMTQCCYPIMQFYTTNGVLCSTTGFNTSSNNNIGVWIIDNYYCLCKNQYRTDESKLTVGPVGFGIYPEANKNNMLVKAVDTLTGSCYKGQFKTAMFIYSGMNMGTISTTNYLPKVYTVGDMFDSGKYIYISKGFWMGWDSSAGNIFEARGNLIEDVPEPVE